MFGALWSLGRRYISLAPYGYRGAVMFRYVFRAPYRVCMDAVIFVDAFGLLGRRIVYRAPLGAWGATLLQGRR